MIYVVSFSCMVESIVIIKISNYINQIRHNKKIPLILDILLYSMTDDVYI